MTDINIITDNEADGEMNVKYLEMSQLTQRKHTDCSFEQLLMLTAASPLTVAIRINYQLIRIE